MQGRVMFMIHQLEQQGVDVRDVLGDDALLDLNEHKIQRLQQQLQMFQQQQIQQGQTMQGQTMQGQTMQGQTMQGQTMQGQTMQTMQESTTLGQWGQESDGGEWSPNAFLNP